MKNVQKELQKLLLLMVFTRERDPVNHLASLMKANNQEEVADNLLKYNKSEELLPLELRENLFVRHTNALMSGGTNRFVMDGSPRGYCLIIVNDEKMYPQAAQVESVFSQLFFKVDLKKNLSKKQIEELFSSITSNEDFERSNALVTYLIGHGINGYFEAQGLVSIPELLNSCAENKHGKNHFENKPKVHIFDCCRSRKHASMKIIKKLYWYIV